MRRARILTGLLAACLLCLPSLVSYSIGSGGILNLVSQARVWIEDADGRHQLPDWKVYVHPLEGSLLAVPANSSTCIALDRNKRHAVKLQKEDLSFSTDSYIVDVPEATPYTILRNRPHFNRTKAQVLLDSGELLIIDVQR